MKLYYKYTDNRVAELATCDKYAKVKHGCTLLFIFQRVGSQKAYYIFGRRVWA